MRIAVTLTIEVDLAAWAEVYGRGASAAEVRKDLRDYVLNFSR